jgi:hypothetical protein
MDTPSLQNIAYNAIFMIFLRIWKFNLPFTFFIMSSLKIIPRHITEKQFSSIRSTGGKVIHQITFYSYDPSKLKRYINRLPLLRHRFAMVRKPMFYSMDYSAAFPFLLDLRNVANNFSEAIPLSEMKVVLPQIAHAIEIKFEKLMWGNEITMAIHKSCSSILITFPINYDFPHSVPSIYQILRDARKQNIHQQPVFTDDNGSIAQRLSNQLILTYVFNCPNCINPIYNYYNSVSEKNRKNDFTTKSFKHKICRCMQCQNEKHQYRKMPGNDHVC